MKKLLYTLLAVSIIFSACKKEDTEGCTNEKSLNYNVDATINDGSCSTFSYGWKSPNVTDTMYTQGSTMSVVMCTVSGAPEMDRLVLSFSQNGTSNELVIEINDFETSNNSALYRTSTFDIEGNNTASFLDNTTGWNDSLHTGQMTYNAVDGKITGSFIFSARAEGTTNGSYVTYGVSGKFQNISFQ